MTIQIRNEGPQDEAAIHALTQAAFRDAAHSSGTEALIVDALRSAGRLSLSLVAEDDGRIVGHLALSPVTLSGGGQGWLGLGPVSVPPDHQQQGIGSQLMQAALRWLQGTAAAGCVVLGDPGYYQRFGFRAYPQLVLPDVPAEYFMALPIQGSVPAASVAYDPAFSATSTA